MIFQWNKNLLTKLSIIFQVKNNDKENIVLGTFFQLLYCPIKAFCFSNTSASVCLSVMPQQKNRRTYCILPFFVSETSFWDPDFKSCIEKKFILKFKCMRKAFRSMGQYLQWVKKGNKMVWFSIWFLLRCPVTISSWCVLVAVFNFTQIWVWPENLRIFPFRVEPGSQMCGMESFLVFNIMRKKYFSNTFFPAAPFDLLLFLRP